MPVVHDYRCTNCGRIFEIFFSTISLLRREMPCGCGGTGNIVYLRAPGLAGVEEPGTRGIKRSFEPGFDVQFGRHFETRKEREMYAQSKGLIGLGPDEFKRSANSARTYEPEYPDMKEGMKEAYDEARSDFLSGRKPELPKVDTDNVMENKNDRRS